MVRGKLEFPGRLWSHPSSPACHPFWEDPPWGPLSTKPDDIPSPDILQRFSENKKSAVLLFWLLLLHNNPLSPANFNHYIMLVDFMGQNLDGPQWGQFA